MDFKVILKEQKEELEGIFDRERIVPREILNSAKKHLAHPNILAVTGIRRCGKSILSYMLVRNERHAYVNFDDERLAGLDSDSLNDILKGMYSLYGNNLEYIVLDEIQNIRSWELFVNRLRRTKKVVITGSNSKLLSGELATSLTGRYIDIELFPFSFKEYLLSRGIRTSDTYTTEEEAAIISQLQGYLESGGMPETGKFGRPALQRLYEDILVKDIAARHKLKKINELKNLSRYLITNSTGEFTYLKLSRILELRSVITLTKWLSFLEQSYLFFILERFSYSLKQQFRAPKKIYCIDNGFISSIASRAFETTGRAMENIVAIELRKRVSIDKRFTLFYWKDHQHREIDFVIKQGLKIDRLIQVTYADSFQEIKEREITSLLSASKALRCNNLTVITWSYDSEKNIKGSQIRFVPLWKWLLTPF